MIGTRPFDPGAPRTTPLDWPDGRAAHAPAPVAIPARFAARLDRVWAVPHHYTHFFFARTRDGIVGEGASPAADAAYVSAISEAMERDLTRWWRPDELQRAPRSALGGRGAPAGVCPPERCVLPTAAERAAAGGRYVAYHDALPLSWLRGAELTADGLVPAWLPASLTLLRFGDRHPAERLAPCLSAGAAAGPTLAHAVRHGLYERIERDAFALTWLELRVRPRLAVRTLADPRSARALARLRADGFVVRFVDITAADVPVVLCAIHAADDWWDHAPRIAFGLGANLDAARAVERAFSEALELMINHFDFRDARQLRVRDSFSAPAGGPDLDAYYTDCRWLFDGPEAPGPRFADADEGEPVDEIRRIRARLAPAGVRIFFADLTPMDLRGSGFRLARVLTTELQPHVYDPVVRRLGGSRLRAGDLNPAPDPYTLLETIR